LYPVNKLLLVLPGELEEKVDNGSTGDKSLVLVSAANQFHFVFIVLSQSIHIPNFPDESQVLEIGGEINEVYHR
jgi:hypothetical protein